MRFGGHETFPIREGWLHKGLRLLVESPDLLSHEYVADYLGVGRNMAKSIRYWLVAARLAEPDPGSRFGKATPLHPTELGELIWRRDPYFMATGTWWAAHINLVNHVTFGLTWSWFFNSFNLERFERAICIESLRRHLEMTKTRQPSIRTIDRDVACLLACYARSIPDVVGDPEDVKTSPLTELGLIDHFRQSGLYRLRRDPKKIGPEILGYCLSVCDPEIAKGRGKTDVRLLDLANRYGGPARCFVLSNEALFETVLAAEQLATDNDIELAGLAGDRVIRVRRRPSIEWIERYYDSIERSDRNAA